MKIKVIAKIGDTIHPRLGMLVKGEEYDIDETEFGDEIFEKQKIEDRSQKTEGEYPEPRFHKSATNKSKEA